MHLINVDLPDPDGPQITIRSPRYTVRSISRKTWNWPNHLLIPFIWITALLERPDVSTVWFLINFSLMLPHSSFSVVCVKFAFQIQTIARHRKAGDEKNNGHKNIGFVFKTQPIGVCY